MGKRMDWTALIR